MHIIIENYINSLTKEQINNVALDNGINFSDAELDFVYCFLKSKWKIIAADPKNFMLTPYKNKFSNENYFKLENLIIKYKAKFKNYL